uniref:Uncharacterized protein n=1 Tax=Caenorhabditis japonica TaxID=281687 RepID=A0A8R1EIW2_CAEJA
MRGKEYKLIVAATLIALTTLTLLIIANADIKRLEKFQFLPKFRKNGVNWTADMQEDIIIEVFIVLSIELQHENAKLRPLVCARPREHSDIGRDADRTVFADLCFHVASRS